MSAVRLDPLTLNDWAEDGVGAVVENEGNEETLTETLAEVAEERSEGSRG